MHACLFYCTSYGTYCNRLAGWLDRNAGILYQVLEVDIIFVYTSTITWYENANTKYCKNDDQMIHVCK